MAPIFAIVINALVTIGSLAYAFGTAKQRLSAVESDMDRLSSELDKMRESSGRVDDRVHDMAVSMGKVETMLSTMVNRNDCPLTGRRRDRAAKSEEA